jgi:hypothetical protein
MGFSFVYLFDVANLQFFADQWDHASFSEVPLTTVSPPDSWAAGTQGNPARLPENS